MSKLVKLSVIGAAGAALFVATPLGLGAAVAGPVGLAAANSVALPAATETVDFRGFRHHHHLITHRSASAPRCVIERRTVYRPRYIVEHRTVFKPRYIVERRTAFVAAPVVAAPVVAAYPAYTYGYYGAPGIVSAGAGLLGGLFDAAWGGGWYGPGWRWRY